MKKVAGVLAGVVIAFAGLTVPAQAAENGYRTTDTSRISDRTFYPVVDDDYLDSPGTFGVFMLFDEDNYDPRHFLLRWEVLDGAGEVVGVPADYVGRAFPSDGDLDLCGQYLDWCKRWSEYWYGRVVGPDTQRYPSGTLLPVGDYTVRAWSYDDRVGASSERLALSQSVTIATGTRIETTEETTTVERDGWAPTAKSRTRTCSVSDFAGAADLSCGARGYARATWVVSVPEGATDIRPQWSASQHKPAHIRRSVATSGGRVTFTARVDGHAAYLLVHDLSVSYTLTTTATVPI